MSQSRQVSKHLIVMLTVISAVGIVYAGVSGAYFCAYDDFDEVHRAAFEDTREPLRILTTPHFHSSHYRPLNRGVTLVTYWVSGGEPVFFRVRNLSFHLLNVVLIYGLGWILFKSMRVSGVGALLFGLHPLANQSINGAVWTNTMAHSGFLLAVVMFITAVRARRHSRVWLAGGLVSGWLSLLMYDPEIVVFGLMLTYLALPFLIRQERQVGGRFLILFVAMAGVLLGSYSLLRTTFVPKGWAQTAADVQPMAVMLKNTGMYVFALLLPVDSVLANTWLGTPLPSEIELNVATLIAAGTSVAVALLLLAFAARRWARFYPANLRRIDWVAAAFLICGIGAPLLPVIMLNERSSETYLYLPVAFYTLLLSYGLDRLLPGAPTPHRRIAYAAVILVLVGLFGAAAWVRNQRVAQCGETARRIVAGLPGPSSMDGVRTVYFSNVAGEPATRRYGLYGFRGIDTIGQGEWADVAVTSLLQWVYRNESVIGKVVEPQELTALCEPASSPHPVCLQVHWDGRVDMLGAQPLSE